MLSFKPNIITLKNRDDRINMIKSFYKSYIDEITFFFGASKDEIIQYKKLITTPMCNKFCSIGMVGCASSHILLWKYISEQEDGYYMIIEDDTYVNFKEIENKMKDIASIFKKYKNIILQITGEGFILKSIEKFNSLSMRNYVYNFFLGCYMLRPDTAKVLYNYFLKNKINYHIDFSLNYVPCIKIGLLGNKEFGEQEGLLDSNMSFGSSKLFNFNDYKRLYYVLNIPLFSLGPVIITFFTIFVFLFIILAILYKNFFICCLIGLIFMDFLKIE